MYIPTKPLPFITTQVREFLHQVPRNIDANRYYLRYIFGFIFTYHLGVFSECATKIAHYVSQIVIAKKQFRLKTKIESIFLSIRFITGRSDETISQFPFSTEKDRNYDDSQYNK